MKKQIRHGLFETNSGPTHVTTIFSAEEFNKWKSGDKVIAMAYERYG